jgi:hypothetical protein
MTLKTLIHLLTLIHPDREWAFRTTQIERFVTDKLSTYPTIGGTPRIAVGGFALGDLKGMSA